MLKIPDNKNIRLSNKNNTMVFNFGERPGLPRQCLEFPQEDQTAPSNHYHESYTTRKISKIIFLD